MATPLCACGCFQRCEGVADTSETVRPGSGSSFPSREKGRSVGALEGSTQFKPKSHSLGNPTSLVMPQPAGSLEGGAHCPVTWLATATVMGLTAPQTGRPDVEAGCGEGGPLAGRLGAYVWTLCFFPGGGSHRVATTSPQAGLPFWSVQLDLDPPSLCLCAPSPILSIPMGEAWACPHIVVRVE